MTTESLDRPKVELDKIDIIQNAIRCPDRKILVSSYRHDCQTHTYVDNEGHDWEYMVDGGIDYVRIGCNPGAPSFESLYLDKTSPFEDVCNKLVWGTRGIKGSDPLKYILIKECDYLNDLHKHLMECPERMPVHAAVVAYWLAY